MDAITLLTIIEERKLRHLKRYSDLIRSGYESRAEMEQAAFAALEQVTTEFISQTGTAGYDLVDAVSTLVIKEEARGLFDTSATISAELPQDFKDALAALMKDGMTGIVVVSPSAK